MCTTPYVSTGRVTKCLANYLWATVPQTIYYRLKVWKVVSMLLRVIILFLEIDSQQTSVHHLASGPHWSQMWHPLGNGGIQQNWQHSVLKFQKHPGPRREFNFQLSPPVCKIQQNWNYQKTIWTAQTRTRDKTEEKETEHPEEWSKKKHRNKTNYLK